MITRNTVRVAEACKQVISGGTPSRRNLDYFSGDIPWVKTMDLDNAQIRNTDENLTQIGLDNSSAKLLPPMTTLIAMYGATVGKTGYLNFEAACNQATCAMIPDTNTTDPRWLFYAIQHTKDRLINLASGAAQQNLNVTLVKNHEIPYHPLDQQVAIAKNLGSLDNKIEANRKVIDLTKDLSIQISRKSSTATKLSSVAQIHRKSINPSLLTESSVAHFSLPSFDDGYPTADHPSSIRSAKNHITEPAVLVSKLNPRIPRIWAIDETPQGTYLASPEFIALQPQEVSVGELWASLADPDFTKSLLEGVTGTTGSHQRVRPEKVMEIEINDPRALTPEKQSTLISLCRLRNFLLQENQTLAATRDELLPLLMSGKIMVKDAEKRVEDEV